MDVYIEKKRAEGWTVIQVAGALGGGGVTELGRVCRDTPGPLVLDLSQLRAVEAGGVRLIRKLAGQGVQISGVSPYVDLLLREQVV